MVGMQGYMWGVMGMQGLVSLARATAPNPAHAGVQMVAIRTCSTVDGSRVINAIRSSMHAAGHCPEPCMHAYITSAMHAHAPCMHMHMYHACTCTLHAHVPCMHIYQGVHAHLPCTVSFNTLLSTSSCFALSRRPFRL